MKQLIKSLYSIFLILALLSSCAEDKGGSGNKKSDETNLSAVVCGASESIAEIAAYFIVNNNSDNTYILSKTRNFDSKDEIGKISKGEQCFLLRAAYGDSPIYTGIFQDGEISYFGTINFSQTETWMLEEKDAWGDCEEDETSTEFWVDNKTDGKIVLNKTKDFALKDEIGTIKSGKQCRLAPSLGHTEVFAGIDQKGVFSYFEKNIFSLSDTQWTLDIKSAWGDCENDERTEEFWVMNESDKKIVLNKTQNFALIDEVGTITAGGECRLALSLGHTKIFAGIDQEGARSYYEKNIFSLSDTQWTLKTKDVWGDCKQDGGSKRLSVYNQLGEKIVLSRTQYFALKDEIGTIPQHSSKCDLDLSEYGNDPIAIFAGTSRMGEASFFEKRYFLADTSSWTVASTSGWISINNYSDAVLLISTSSNSISSSNNIGVVQGANYDSDSNVLIKSNVVFKNPIGTQNLYLLPLNDKNNDSFLAETVVNKTEVVIIDNIETSSIVNLTNSTDAPIRLFIASEGYTNDHCDCESTGKEQTGSYEIAQTENVTLIFRYANDVTAGSYLVEGAFASSELSLEVTLDMANTVKFLSTARRFSILQSEITSAPIERFTPLTLGLVEIASTSNVQIGDFTRVGYASELPVHAVSLNSFIISDHEVTLGEYRRYDSSHNNVSSIDCEEEDCPVTGVSWDDAQDYISWLNYNNDDTTYRLCTEAEWEYAARAGTTSNWFCGDQESCLLSYSWHSVNSGNHVHQVKTKSPNANKLYDMHGNVYEWVHDWYDSDFYSVGTTNNPTGPVFGTERVIRGGDYSSIGESRSAYRDKKGNPADSFHNVGFRLCGYKR